MRFNLERTSHYRGSDIGVPEATNTVEEYPGGLFKSWHVEINSLEELVNFSNKYGTLVFNEDTIEIYDDYRE